MTELLADWVRVEAITPLRIDGKVLPPTGTAVMAADEAGELERLGALKILAVIDGTVAADRAGAVLALVVDEVGVIQRLGHFDDEAAAITAAAPFAAAAVNAADELKGWKDLAESRLDEIIRLEGELRRVQTGGDTASPAPATAPTAPQPAPVSIEMRLADLRKIAADEGVKFDNNDTKAELVAKIGAGRVTARGAA